MSKLVAFVLIAASVGLSAATSQAMPLGSNRTQDSLVIPVAGGCGIAWHRGPYGGCRRNYYGGYCGRSVVVDQGGCSGHRMHLVCNAYGICWGACN